MRIQTEFPIEEGQEFVIDDFSPADARGVINLFLSVYGTGYPVQTFYDPDLLTAEHQKKNIISAVARTRKGDIIAFGAIIRSSPPHPKLMEVGQFVVHIQYRTTFAIFKINKYLIGDAAKKIGVDALFGEAVCNHPKTQKIGIITGAIASALEVDLMPAEAYDKEHSAHGRVSCMMQTIQYHDAHFDLFMPSRYQKEMAFLANGFEFDRTFSPPPSLPMEGQTQIISRIFSFAQVGRYQTMRIGGDFPAAAGQFESDGLKEGVLVFQFFLDLKDPGLDFAIEHLHSRKYFFCGYLPRWFDSDGILMEKLMLPPSFETIQTLPGRNTEILNMVKDEYERSGKQS